MRTSFKLELEEARHMVAAIRKSEEIGVLETVCVSRAIRLPSSAWTARE